MAPHEECVNGQVTITAINLLCFGGFCALADDPSKPWRLRTELFQRPVALVGMVFGGLRACPWGSIENIDFP